MNDNGGDWRLSREEIGLLFRYGCHWPWNPEDMVRLIRKIEDLESDAATTPCSKSIG